MSCKIYSFPDPQDPTRRSTGIVCSVPERKAPRCKFCRNPSTVLCDWPTLKVHRIFVNTLKPRQRLLRGTQKEPEWFYVVAIAPGPERFTEITLRGERNQEVKFVEPWMGTISVYRQGGTCSAPACAEHSKNVGKNKDYCQEHAALHEHEQLLPGAQAGLNFEEGA